LTIYIGESDQWQGTSLYIAIIQLLREYRCAGATASRAIAGYGAGGRLRANGQWQWSSDATIVIQVIDQPERLRRLLPRLQEMLNGGLITLHDIDVLKYTHAQRRGFPKRVTVQQVMETSVTTVNLDTPTSIIIDTLLAAPFRTLPVVDSQGRLQGIISTGDLINAGVFPLRRGLLRAALTLDAQTVESIDASLLQARRSTLMAQDIMNKEVRSVRPEQPLRDAAQLMLDTGVRRLPVITQNAVLVGMLTRADLLHTIVTSPLMSPQSSSATQPLQRTGSLSPLPAQQQSISEYVNPDVSVVSEYTTVEEIIDALILSPLKRVIVVDREHRVQGIISDMDVLARLQAEARPRFLAMLTEWTRNKQTKPGPLALGITATAMDIMNRDVVTISETVSVQDAIEKMMTTRRKILPVVDAQGRLLGVVGRSDLLRVLVEG
jgi:CBS-domain-containing membrane protein